MAKKLNCSMSCPGPSITRGAVAHSGAAIASSASSALTARDQSSACATRNEEN